MYQVWTKDEYTDGWALTEIEDMDVLKAAILTATKHGREIKVSVPMEVLIDVKVGPETLKALAKKEEKLTKRQKREKEAAEHEAEESGPEEDKGPGDPGNSPV